MLAISVLHALSDAIASTADYRLCPRLDPPATPEKVLTMHRAPAGARRPRRADDDRARPDPARSCSTAQEPVVLVQVAAAKGSTPREAGTAMLVTRRRGARHDRRRPARVGGDPARAGDAG